MKTVIRQIDELMNRVEPGVRVVEVLPVHECATESFQGAQLRSDGSEVNSDSDNVQFNADDLQFN